MLAACPALAKVGRCGVVAHRATFAHVDEGWPCSVKRIKEIDVSLDCVLVGIGESRLRDFLAQSHAGTCEKSSGEGERIVQTRLAEALGREIKEGVIIKQVI